MVIELWPLYTRAPSEPFVLPKPNSMVKHSFSYWLLANIKNIAHWSIYQILYILVGIILLDFDISALNYCKYYVFFAWLHDSRCAKCHFVSYIEEHDNSTAGRMRMLMGYLNIEYEDLARQYLPPATFVMIMLRVTMLLIVIILILVHPRMNASVSTIGVKRVNTWHKIKQVTVPKNM